MAEYGGSNSQSGTQYPVTDHLGSTRLIVDANGNCVTRTDYAPFGSLVPPPAGQVCSGQQPSSGMLFIGQSRDGDTAAGTSTGLDYFGARFYWASLGRFTGADPENAGADAGSPQSWNGYSYVLNNPMMYTHPSGMYLPAQKQKDDGEDTRSERTSLAIGARSAIVRRCIQVSTTDDRDPFHPN